MTFKHICTKEDPWTPDKGTPACHPEAREVGEQRDGYPGGDLQSYECPICGIRWESELPQ